jgi:hypothetical protein
MRDVPIKEVSLGANDCIVVTPDLAPDDSFSQIYRAALPAEWMWEARALTVLPESRLSHVDAFTGILRAASEEYGCRLQLNAETRWVNISATLQAALRGVAASDA